jgi:hypothetical protein
MIPRWWFARLNLTQVVGRSLAGFTHGLRLEFAQLPIAEKALVLKLKFFELENDGRWKDCRVGKMRLAGIW